MSQPSFFDLSRDQNNVPIKAFKLQRALSAPVYLPADHVPLDTARLAPLGCPLGRTYEVDGPAQHKILRAHRTLHEACEVLDVPTSQYAPSSHSSKGSLSSLPSLIATESTEVSTQVCGGLGITLGPGICLDYGTASAYDDYTIEDDSASGVFAFTAPEPSPAYTEWKGFPPIPASPALSPALFGHNLYDTPELGSNSFPMVFDCAGHFESLAEQGLVDNPAPANLDLLMGAPLERCSGRAVEEHHRQRSISLVEFEDPFDLSCENDEPLWITSANFYRESEVRCASEDHHPFFTFERPSRSENVTVGGTDYGTLLAPGEGFLDVHGNPKVSSWNMPRSAPTSSSATYGPPVVVEGGYAGIPPVYRPQPLNLQRHGGFVIDPWRLEQKTFHAVAPFPAGPLVSFGRPTVPSPARRTCIVEPVPASPFRGAPSFAASDDQLDPPAEVKFDLALTDGRASQCKSLSMPRFTLRKAVRRVRASVRRSAQKLKRRSGRSADFCAAFTPVTGIQLDPMRSSQIF